MRLYFWFHFRCFQCICHLIIRNFSDHRKFYINIFLSRHFLFNLKIFFQKRRFQNCKIFFHIDFFCFLRPYLIGRVKYEFRGFMVLETRKNSNFGSPIRNGLRQQQHICISHSGYIAAWVTSDKVLIQNDRITRTRFLGFVVTIYIKKWWTFWVNRG